MSFSSDIESPLFLGNVPLSAMDSVLLWVVGSGKYSSKGWIRSISDFQLLLLSSVWGLGIQVADSFLMLSTFCFGVLD